MLLPFYRADAIEREADTRAAIEQVAALISVMNTLIRPRKKRMYVLKYVSGELAYVMAGNVEEAKHIASGADKTPEDWELVNIHTVADFTKHEAVYQKIYKKNEKVN